jgi:hypothetical protein
MQVPAADEQTDNAGRAVDRDADCICAAAASRSVVKSPHIKLKKQIAAIALAWSGTIADVDPPDRSALNFTKPYYLSDSFYDLAPKRGPPLL